MQHVRMIVFGYEYVQACMVFHVGKCKCGSTGESRLYPKGIGTDTSSWPNETSPTNPYNSFFVWQQGTEQGLERRCCYLLMQDVKTKFKILIGRRWAYGLPSLAQSLPITTSIIMATTMYDQYS